jgi:hypothetical protein
MSTVPVAPPALIAAELTRICESDALRRAPSHLRLLRYLVERALEDDAAALTETAIAIAVFRRDPVDYDPHVDPIVRVAVARLRARLDLCYRHSPAARPVRILVPRGGYRPRFVVGQGDAAPPPRLVVLSLRSADAAVAPAPYCRAFPGLLADALARLGEPVIADPHRPPRRAGGGAGAPGHTAGGAEALLDPMLTTDADGSLRLTVRLLDAVDGNVRWIETMADAPRRRASLARRMVTRVVARLVPAAPLALGS